MSKNRNLRWGGDMGPLKKRLTNWEQGRTFLTVSTEICRCGTTPAAIDLSISTAWWKL